MDVATSAFNTLKTAMINAAILAAPDFSLSFVVETDASGHGLGDVLLQAEHPIAYYSKILGIRNRGKPIYEKELMTIVFAVEKWRHYLLDRHFVVRTNHWSLKFLLEQKEMGQTYQRWVSKLLGYTFAIHKPGPTNKVADALSRQHSPEFTCSTLVVSCGLRWDYVQAFIAKDATLQRLVSQFQK